MRTLVSDLSSHTTPRPRWPSLSLGDTVVASRLSGLSSRHDRDHRRWITPTGEQHWRTGLRRRSMVHAVRLRQHIAVRLAETAL
jgi:hypothetical protein